MSVLFALASIGWVAALVARMPLLLRMFQIEEYEWRRFVRWARLSSYVVSPRCLFPSLVVAIVTIVFAGVSAHAFATWGWIIPLIGAGLVVVTAPRITAKKPLVWTARAKRLWVVACALAIVVGALLTLASIDLGSAIGVGVVWAVAVVAIPAFAISECGLAKVILSPVERRISAGYVSQARATLTTIQPTVIGVVGSWGKTTTKQMIVEATTSSLHSAGTPKSFNTLLGVTRAINEGVTAPLDLYVVEMDAYGRGEIASICELVSPTYAVVTAIGPQHLERFSGQDEISDALFEVVAALPKGGAAVICQSDVPDTFIRKVRRERNDVRVVTYGWGSEQRKPDVVVDRVTLSAHGTHSTFVWEKRGIDVELATPLLGRHQALNAAAATIVALLAGVPLDKAVGGLGSMPQVEHRLQVIPTPAPITVIDDSYNANPTGVHNGLEVLEQFAGGRILVTPGMVELGSKEDEENVRYGEHAAHVCSHVILMASPSARAVGRGLARAAGPKAIVHTVETLEAAQEVIARVARPGDVVLFANDLPDTYIGVR